MTDSLKAYNSFGLDATCDELIHITSVRQLQSFLSTNPTPFFILGGGSNILLPTYLKGTVIRNEIKGKKIVSEDDQHVIVEIGGGENWHEFVLWSIDQGYGGIENLSLIPGTVGAAPMQNIGAYGVEINDVFDSLECVSLDDGVIHSFDKDACEFGYRTSIFKTTSKGKYFITSVRFKLSKQPILRLSYGAIKNVLEQKGITLPSIKDVSDAVIEIRNSKLPNPSEIGNAGSFFKNPIIASEQAAQLAQQFEDMPAYPSDPGKTKLSAGWLIEQCGWKGKELGGAACYANHALILINKNKATSEEIKNLAAQIQASVKARFDIDLEPEVNFV